jgi:hypothetical protein
MVKILHINIEDQRTTTLAVQAGVILGISVIDHLAVHSVNT